MNRKPVGDKTLEDGYSLHRRALICFLVVGGSHKPAYKQPWRRHVSRLGVAVFSLRESHGPKWIMVALYSPIAVLCIGVGLYSHVVPVALSGGLTAVVPLLLLFFQKPECISSRPEVEAVGRRSAYESPILTMP